MAPRSEVSACSRSQRTHTLVRLPTVHFSKIRPFDTKPSRLGACWNRLERRERSLDLSLPASQAADFNPFGEVAARAETPAIYSIRTPCSCGFGVENSALTPGSQPRTPGPSP